MIIIIGLKMSIIIIITNINNKNSNDSTNKNNINNYFVCIAASHKLNVLIILNKS